MEIIRVIPLIIFVLFCSEIVFKRTQLKRNGILVSGFKFSFKTIFATVFLVAFFATFISELLFQSLLTSYSILPKFIQNNIFYLSTLEIFGILILALSVISMHLTLVGFKNSLRFGFDDKNLGNLVTTGIFSYSRNPFFVSILLLLLGKAMVFPTPFFVGVFILSLLSIHVVILKEEKFMRENYGEEYNKYAEKVRRYF